MPTQIQMRRGTQAEWDAANPVLADGEHGLVTDTGEVRAGDGSTAFADLPPILSGTYRKSQNATMVVLGSDQTISNNTLTVVSWGSTEFDDLGAWASGNPTRLTVPSGISRARFWVMTAWGSDSTGSRQLRLNKNGSKLLDIERRPASFTTPATSEIVLPIGTNTIASGDYFELLVYQNSGAAINLKGSNNSGTQFGMEKLA